jgi:hypothetical protein
MDHTAIQDNQVPDRYLMGKLSAEEQAEFEEHFVDCPVCLAHLESVEGLRAGLKELSAPARAAGPEPPRILPFPGRRRTVLLLAAACLAVAVLPPALFYGRYRRATGELASARAEFDAARGRNDELKRALERERAAGASAAVPPRVAAFTLNLTRGSGGEASSNRISPRDPREWVIVLLDRPEAPKAEGYQAKLTTADGRAAGGPLAASEASGDMLAVGVPPGLLAAGDYVLTLEGVGPGAPRELARYRFRVTPAK